MRVWKLKWPLACSESTMGKQAEKRVQFAECASESESLVAWEDDEKGRASGKAAPGLLAPGWTGNICRQKKRIRTRCFLHHREGLIILLLNEMWQLLACSSQCDFCCNSQLCFNTSFRVGCGYSSFITFTMMKFSHPNIDWRELICLVIPGESSSLPESCRDQRLSPHHTVKERNKQGQPCYLLFPGRVSLKTTKMSEWNSKFFQSR